MKDTKQLESGIKKLGTTLKKLDKKVAGVEKKQQNQPEKTACPISGENSSGCPHSQAASANSYWQNIYPPLLRPGAGQNDPEILASLGPLAALIGTWVSNPRNGFNVMPLPEATARDGFILKNFFYYEEVTFSAIAGKVANRGGTDEQDSYTLFYEQRVFFSDGPQKDQLVHAENGAWLHLIKTQQKLGPVGFGPMPSPPAPDPVPPQDPATEIVKQVSVPHGNSILANGSFTVFEGRPEIPDVSALPIDAPESFNLLYGPNEPGNPNVNPNVVLQGALSLTPEEVLRTTLIDVDSDNQGNVVNTPFMVSHINVSRFRNQLWLEELATGAVQMQYSQNITLDFPQADGTVIQFPHIVANTLRKIA
ncbi:MAG: heme-binding protein [Endozoicomonas sp.]